MGRSAVYQLLSNISVVGNGSTFTVGQGGTYSYAVAATNFGGSVAALQMIGPDGATFINVPGVTPGSANAMVNVDLPAGARVRSTLTGGTPNTVSATLSFIR